MSRLTSWWDHVHMKAPLTKYIDLKLTQECCFNHVRGGLGRLWPRKISFYNNSSPWKNNNKRKVSLVHVSNAALPPTGRFLQVRQAQQQPLDNKTCIVPWREHSQEAWNLYSSTLKVSRSDSADFNQGVGGKHVLKGFLMIIPHLTLWIIPFSILVLADPLN